MIDNIKILSRLLMLFRPYWGWMLIGICLSLLTIMANVSLLALSGWFITIMAIAGAAGITEINYFTPAAAIRGFAIARTAGRYGERVVTHEATFRCLASLRVWFYEHLEPLAPAVLQKYHSADLLSRIRADIDKLENFYLRIFSPVIVAALATLIYGLFLNRFDTQLFIAEITLLIIAGIVIPLIVNRKAKASGERLINTKADLRVAVTDSVQGLSELLIYGKADALSQKLEQQTQELIIDQQQQAHLFGFSQAAILLVANLAMWLMLLVSIPLVTEQKLEPASIPMLALFALASFEAIAPLPLALQLLPETLKAARRVFEIVDSEPLVKEPQSSSPVPTNFDLVFENVSFAYVQGGKKILDSLSFNLPQGQNLGIVGESGIGKTSIVNLLLKFWPASKGKISLGCHLVDQFHSNDFRKYFSVVSQQTILFNSTIKRNLLLAKNDASDAELEQVCRVAQIHEFIMNQPEGYDTWVGEAGLKLSGGQSRRLAVARALLKDAPILILDEPGEGLDSSTEKQMLDEIFDFKSDSSILLITHKKAGLEMMDQVITFNE